MTELELLLLGYLFGMHAFQGYRAVRRRNGNGK